MRVLRCAALLILLSIFGGCTDNEDASKRPRQANYEPIIVNVKQTGDECLFTVNGQSFSRESLTVLSDLAKPDPERPVEIHVAGESPYRCIGAAISIIQSAGLSKLAFVSSPP